LKLPDLEPHGHAFWNGKNVHLELAFVKRQAPGEYVPVVRCNACGDMWRDEWVNVLPEVFDVELRRRLQRYHDMPDD